MNILVRFKSRANNFYSGFTSSFKPITNFTCVCLGEALVFECSVIDSQAGSTVYKGSSFDCANSNNDIVLLHSRFSSTNGTCNNGAIIARSLRMESNYSYTSRLYVTNNYDILGENISCILDNGTDVRTIETISIPLLTTATVGKELITPL